MLRAGRKTRGVVAAVAMAAAALVMTTGAGAAPSKARTVAFTQTSTGTTVTQDDGSLVGLGAGTSSPGGDYAFTTKSTLAGTTVTTTGTMYHADGAGTFKETATLGAPDANGVIAMTGTGTCTGHGTGKHKNEKCKYTITGTTHAEGSVYVFTAEISGTYTR
jgi:hypothetical protein